MALVGFVSDRDILYDSVINKNVFVVLILLYCLELLGAALPFLFYDLDDKKLAIIQRDLDQRKKDEEQAKVETAQVV